MKNRSFLRLSALLLAFSILFLNSCKKEVLSEGDGRTTFYETDELVMQFTCSDGNVEFFIDALYDKTDGRTGIVRNRDAYVIFIDYNNNGLIDPLVDLRVSPFSTTTTDRTCISYFLERNISTPCNFFDDITRELNFSPTENSDVPHMNYSVKLPKERIAKDSKIGIVIEIFDSETREWQNFPITGNVFSNTIEI
ncbi:MAG: hypothetical protein AAGG68_22535, partial [Bacteroidota bacterium]